MKLKLTFIVFLISIFILNLGLIYANNINKQNSNFLRIHVVANSDSIDDQLLKYNIAKKVDRYINKITVNCNNKSESKQVIAKNIQNILNICNETIKENDLNYPVKAYIGKLSYEEKQKDSIHMNAGIYDSLKIIIGDGHGQNWWSLIYPSNLNISEEYDMFSQETKYSFRIIELFQKLL